MTKFEKGASDKKKKASGTVGAYAELLATADYPVKGLASVAEIRVAKLLSSYVRKR